MKYQDYEVAVLIDGTEYEIPLERLSFSMTDSIHRLYSQASVSLADTGGMYQEFMATTEGNLISLRLGVGNSQIENKFVIRRDEQQEFDSLNRYSGKVDIELVNAWFNTQYEKSEAYKGRIDFVVQKVTQNAGFSETHIQSTGNDDTWYQAMMSDARFLRDVLLPNAFSRNAENTPFYMWIDSANEFHFQNLKTLWGALDSNYDQKYTLIQNSTEMKEFGEQQQYGILDMKRISGGSDQHRQLRDWELHQFNPDTGDLVKTEVHMRDYPKPKSGYYLPISNNVSQSKSHVTMMRGSYTKGQEENVKGQIVHRLRNSMFLDRFMIVVPLNTELKAGDTIFLEVPLVLQEEIPISNRFTGKYVIELAEHIWNGDDMDGYSKFLIGRKYVKVSKDVSIRPYLEG